MTGGKKKSGIPDPDSLEILAQQDFNVIIDKHLMFVRGQRGGARAVLKYRNLSYLNFHNANLSQADFTGSLLMGADLSFGIFRSASFFACDLRNADMSRADFSRADFRGAVLSGADLTGADMTGTDLREGKIMTSGPSGGLEDRKRPGSPNNSRTIFTGAKMMHCDLSGSLAKAADFTEADLKNAVFREAQMTGATFKNANLSGGDFTGADLSHSDMRGSIRPGLITFEADLFGVNTRGSMAEGETGAKLDTSPDALEALLREHTAWVSSAGKKGQRLDLSGYDLRDVVNLHLYPLTAIKAEGANFVGQELRRANMQSGLFDQSDFRDCVLENADLRGGGFKNCKMTRSNLRGANLSALYFKRGGETRMKRADFSGSVLRFADLRSANLQDSVMMGVDLTSADLSGADLRGADFTGAAIKNAKFDGCLMDKAKIDFSGL